MQQDLLYQHLRAQFHDRCCYWQKRGLSRARGLELVIMSDGMDQGKFSLPRHPVMRSKQFDSWSRPRLHVCATLGHGWCLNFYVSEGNLCKDSNTSIEVISHTMSVLQGQGYNLPAASVTLQGDNTCREMKNGMVMRWAASLVSDHRVKEINLSFLRSGHSHEDLDQCFGQAADWIRRRLHRAESSDEVVACLNDWLGHVDRPHEAFRRCYKLDSTRDWYL